MDTTTRRGKALSDEELASLIQHTVQGAVGFTSDTYTRFRIRAQDLYDGKTDLIPHMKGRSRVVSRDVAEAVDTLASGLMRIFTSVPMPCRFEATKPGDDALAEQVTDYVSYVWNTVNPGWSNTFQVVKAALMFRLAALKIYWDDFEYSKTEEYSNLTQDEYEALAEDPAVEVTEIAVYPDEDILQAAKNRLKIMAAAAVQVGMDPTPPKLDADKLPKRYDVTVKRLEKRGKIKVDLVPSEELIFSSYKVHQDDEHMIGHRRLMTASELRLLKVSEDKIKQLPFGDNGDYLNQEKLARHSAEYNLITEDNGAGDPSKKQTWITEVYMWVDTDGDGIAEYRKITVGGNSEFVVLDNVEVDSHPFAVFTPIEMPFKMCGLSITDLTSDIQEIKTVAMRQMLDNWYLTNHQKYLVNSNVFLDDIMQARPGGFVRTKGNGPVGNDLVPLTPTMSVAQDAQSLLQFMDDTREARTGITRFNQGLGADEIAPQTATMANLISNAGNVRMELVARTLAEGGFATAMRKIYDLAKKHEDRDVYVKLRGNWIPMRPTDWKAEFTLTPLVGLGTGNRDAEYQRIMQMFPVISEVAQSPFASIISQKNVYDMLVKLADSAGLKNPEFFFTDPNSPEGQAAQAKAAQAAQQQQPDPMVQLEQAKVQQTQIQIQEKSREFNAKHELATQQAIVNANLQKQKLSQDHEANLRKIELEALKLHHSDKNAANDRELAALKLHHEAAANETDNATDLMKMHHDAFQQEQDRATNQLNTQIQRNVQADAMQQQHANTMAQQQQAHENALEMSKANLKPGTDSE